MELNGGGGKEMELNVGAETELNGGGGACKETELEGRVYHE